MDLFTGAGKSCVKKNFPAQKNCAQPHSVTRYEKIQVPAICKPTRQSAWNWRIKLCKFNITSHHTDDEKTISNKTIMLIKPLTTKK